MLQCAELELEASKKTESGQLTSDSAALLRLELSRFVIQTRFYFFRVWGASAAWMANDVVFYGNLLFQGVVMSILYPAVGIASHSTVIKRDIPYVACMAWFLMPLFQKSPFYPPPPPPTLY